MLVDVAPVALARGTGAWFTGRPRAGAGASSARGDDTGFDGAVVGLQSGDGLGGAGNLAHTRPHRPATLAATRADACRQMLVDAQRIVLMRQVHGGDVAIVDDTVPEGAQVRSVDGLVTAATDRPLVVQVADCVPILAAVDHGPVAVAHAGRRGVQAGIVASLLRSLAQLGADPVDLHVVLGPSIGGCCYEVPEDLQADLEAQHPAAQATTTWGTPSLDLGAAILAEMAEAGVADVRRLPGCTHCDPDGRWFSHRADPSAGRQWGVVVRRGLDAPMRHLGTAA